MEETKIDSKKVGLSSFIEAPIPIVVIMGLMLLGFVGETGYTDAHIPLVVSIYVTCIIGGFCGHSFSDVFASMLDRLNATMGAILTLCTVGILIMSFIMSGTIPAVTYYGLDLPTPRLFLSVDCIMCAIAGLTCGSSWTATVTIGTAFPGIGAGLSIDPAITADMIIFGAYPGDKLSPPSDTTNLATAVSGTGLLDHVMAVVSMTTPIFVIALILHMILGTNINTVGCDPQVVVGLQTALASKFSISLLLLIPVIAIIVACVMKLPGLVGIAISVLYGVLLVATFQGMTSIGDIFKALHYGIMVETGNEIASKLLNRGGIDHQMWTINPTLLTITYGGTLERCGCVGALFDGLKNRLYSVGQLVLATLLTSFFCDAIVCDQFLGIGVPVPLYSDKYDEIGLVHNMLSGTLEDYGTLWVVMFPWTNCGTYQMGVLGAHPFTYFLFAFVNLLNPTYAVITTFLGRNVFWTGGVYTNIFGKVTMRKPVGAPEEAHEVIIKNPERLRAEGKAPKVDR